MKSYTSYLLQNITQGFKQAWKSLGVGGRIIGGVINLIAIIILGIKEGLKTTLLPVGITLVLFIFIGVIFGIFVLPYQKNNKLHEENVKLNKKIMDLKKRKKEPPELKKLLGLRTEGVQTRNKGQKIGQTSLVRAWIEAYEDWNHRVIGSLSKLSKSQADWFETLDIVPRSGLILQTSDSEHQKYFNIFCEKLRRLDKILRGYLHIAQD